MADVMNLRLMPDYDCHPVWEISHDGVRNVDPNDLPISDQLKSHIRHWAERFDATLCAGDPASSGFASPADEADFEREGLRLWAALRAELGERAVVTYFSQLERREIH